MIRRLTSLFLCLLLLCTLPAIASAGERPHTVARQWNDLLLDVIRRDFARPTTHARNLFHFSIAVWDSWAIYDVTATPYLMTEEVSEPFDLQAAREETMSFACYRLITSRFADSPGRATTLPPLRAKMIELGYNPDYVGIVGQRPAAIGNRIALTIQAYGLADLSNEQNEYAPNNGYAPINPPMIVKETGVGFLSNPNRWQPLALDSFIDQSGNPLPGGIQNFLGPHWGQLPPFALAASDEGPRDVFLDPGRPPFLNTAAFPIEPAEDLEFRDMFTDLVRLQAKMSPDLSETIDISPASRGNNPLATNDGTGHPINPVTGQSYAPQFVKLGDWSRCIAEFWADGPDSETPPGHWNTLANYVTDQTQSLIITGEGFAVDPLEWDAKLYLALNGAMYDAAIAAWGCKGYYDYVRPISAIRYMCSRGQSSDPGGPSYDPHGILLEPGVIEVITADSATSGSRHAHLADHIGEIAVLAWPGVPEDPDTQHSGVAWILGADWVPYQRDTFVTPPFAGYVSGHSTFSRAGAEVMTAFTGSMYFPGGLGVFDCPKDEFLVFEQGPSESLQLQWATYYDAADEASLSRLWGGIHPRGDDFPGRRMGAVAGRKAWEKALTYYNGTARPLDPDGWMFF